VLARKLGAEPEPLPVTRAVLDDFDVVYSAHISAYGSVPATIQRSAGTESPVFVAHPTDEQLRRISESEPNYELRVLRDVACRPVKGDPPDEVAAYVSRHGCLAVDGCEVALSSVRARARRFPAMSQVEILEWARLELCPERALHDFIETAIAGPDASKRWGERLRAGATALT
jgi:hypothetical protein